MNRKVLPALLALALLAALPAAAEMTVDEIIAKNVEAKGGRAAIDKVKTMQISGRMGLPGGMEAPFVMTFKRPDQFRMEFTIQGMTGVQSYDGKVGWFVMPFAGKTVPEAMSGDQLEEAVSQADFDGVLIDYREKGATVELIGKEEVEGTEAYNLKVTKKNGDVDHYFIDAEYFLEIRVEAQREIEGTEIEAASNFGDYKEVDGLMIAHSISQARKGAPAAEGTTLTMEKIETNIEIPADFFAMPVAKAAEGE